LIENVVPYARDMTIRRMDNVGIVFNDLAAAIAFFVELGLELEGETTVEGSWVDRVVGLDDVRSDIAMMRTPDGHSRLELRTSIGSVTSAAPKASSSRWPSSSAKASTGPNVSQAKVITSRF
jgi:hypothetical protein